MQIIQDHLLIVKIGTVVTTLTLSLFNFKSARAVIFVENLSQITNNSLLISSSIIQGSNFTTDNNSYSLNSVTARFLESTESDFSLNLYTNNGSQPGTFIESLNTTADIISGSFDDYLFTPNNSVSLDANTTYWLIGSLTSGSYSWGATNSFDQTGDWTIGDDYAFSIDGGGSWSLVPGFTSQFSIDADITSTAVPFEFSPAMGILLVGSLFGAKATYRKYQAIKVKVKS